MSGAGRPLRFLGAAIGGWSVVRLAFLWPQVDSLPSLIRVLAPPVAAATRVPFATPHRRIDVEPDPPVPTTHVGPPPPTVMRAVDTLADPPRAPEPPPVVEPSPLQPPPLRPAPLATPPDRFAASAWLIARGGGVRGAATGGQLGASQAGARLTYALGRRLALAARASAPLEGRGKEVAIGIDWQPADLPIHLLAEQRIAVDGGRGGPTLLVIGGVDPTPVALGFRLDAYGQAGGILRGGRVDAFADGAARLLRPVAAIGRTRVELGGGLWGGAQRGAARLDLGPSAAAILPLGRRSVRVALDWRQRIAGGAAPGSGPALSIGGDF